MLGLSLWEGRLPGQKTIENEDKAAMGSYRPESNFGTSDTVDLPHPPPMVRSIDAKLSTSQLPQATSPGLGTHQMPAIDASSSPISLAKPQVESWPPATT